MAILEENINLKNNLNKFFEDANVEIDLKIIKQNINILKKH